MIRILLLFLIFIHSAYAQDLTGIDQIINNNNFPKFIGIKIQSMTNNKILYQKNPDQLFVPASNLKLFTALSALLYLKPNYTFQTQLYKKNNNLYIKFQGDPTLTDIDLKNLLADQKNYNHIYIDNTYLNDRNAATGWMWDELNICYAAPISSIMINHNCVDYTLSSQDLSTESNKNLISIINKTTTNSNYPLDLTTIGNNQYVLTGSLPEKPLNLSIAVSNPELYAEQIIQNITHKLVSLKNIPKDAELINTHNSKPLSDLINTMLKNSDNQIANILFKTIGAKYSPNDPNWQSGSMALKKILPIDLSNSIIVDGAGISRYNLVSPNQISELLNYIYKNHILINNLPINDEDGTLRNRMQSIKGKVRAKTGTMTNVSTLAGFVDTQNYGTVSFVIMLNNFSVKEKTATDLEDQIVEYLHSL